jgi:hypothetical protein
MVQQYRKKVGSKTGGIKLYNELKSEMIKQDINIGRDKFYRFLRRNNLLIPKRKTISQLRILIISLENIRTLLKIKSQLVQNSFG